MPFEVGTSPNLTMPSMTTYARWSIADWHVVCPLQCDRQSHRHIDRHKKDPHSQETGSHFHRVSGAAACRGDRGRSPHVKCGRERYTQIDMVMSKGAPPPGPPLQAAAPPRVDSTLLRSA